MLVFTLHLSATGFGQISFEAKNMPIRDVFEILEKETGCRFFYNDDLKFIDKTVNMKVSDQNIDQVLNRLFESTGLSYKKLDNDLVVVAPMKDLQQNVVTGKVTDASNGDPMPGVNILVKGTTIGTLTDVEGRYSLELTSGDPVLVFSFIGYATREVSVSGRSQIDVELSPELTGLDEVVVIGYGTAKKSDLTGAIAQVKAEDLKNYSPSNVSDLLRTSIPGLNVGYATSAKGNSSIQIRGETTLTAGSSPLIVVDGVIYNGDLSDINPDDIDRMDIMKDASSAAVYGSRATNGVISITTKRGSSDKATINFSTTLGIATAANRVRPYDKDTFIQWRSDMFKSVFSATVPQEPWSPFDDPRTIDAQYLNEWLAYHGTTQENMVDAWLSGLRLTGREATNYKEGNIIDWEDIIYHNGKRQDYNLSLSGKHNDLTYYWSLGYMDNEALTIGDEFSTIRSRINLEGKAADFLKVGLNANFSYRNESSVPANNDQYMNLTPYSSYYADDGITLRLYPNDDIQASHPLLERTYRDRENEYYIVAPKIYTILELPFGISYTMNFSTKIDFYHNYVHDSSKHPAWGLYGGAASRDNSLRREWQIDNIINWNRTFNEQHRIDVTLLANAEKIRIDSDGMDNRTFSPNDILGYHDMSTGTLPELVSDDQVQTADALMARLNYGFKNRYLLTTSIRRDGSSLFGYSNPRATFPAIALGWVISEESFFKLNFVNYLKLRASWGVNGNRSITNYAALSRIAASKSLNANQNGVASTIPLLVINTMENKGLKWERTQTFNLGMDFTLLEGILRGAVEVYSTSTTDVLVNRELPTITGYNRVYANLGEVRNKGLELSLSSMNMAKRNFEWHTDLVFSLNRNKIVSITGEKFDVYDKYGNVIGNKEPDDKTNNWFIGQAKDVIWDYRILGTWRPGEEAEAAKWNQAPGDFKLQDVNNDGLLTDDDKQFQGYTTPRFTWTLTNSFNIYRNFEASFVLYSLWGQKSVYDLAKHDNHIEDRRNSWDIPYWTPDNLSDKYARLRSAPAAGVGYSSWFDRSYIRFENIAIAYKVPGNILNNTFINSVKVSFNIRNVGVWAPEWIFGDPEDGTRAQRIFSFGLNLTI